MPLNQPTDQLQKHYLDEDTLIQDSFRLGVKIFESGFRPSFIVGLWRGGSAVGIYVQECLQTLGLVTDHISVRTSYQGQANYQQILEQPDSIRVHGIQYLLENLNVDDSLLIVDDVFSSGHNVVAVINRLQSKLKRNMPTQVKVATLWERPKFNQTQLKPDFCLHQTEQWLVFPYELTGLSPAEIAEHKPFVAPLIKTEQTK
ncbi:MULTISPECIES: phosphoribosyltransferase [unclassified Agarivorans]|uniref:phosphoribosyltransferase n=1 Tax=unclassified Agarivorans TaxID=2636026 RepID=UPI003D7F0792